MKNNTKKNSIISKDGVSYLIPFILITSCFALWGFANDITNPMVKAFSKIFRKKRTVEAENTTSDVCQRQSGDPL